MVAACDFVRSARKEVSIDSGSLHNDKGDIPAPYHAEGMYSHFVAGVVRCCPR